MIYTLKTKNYSKIIEFPVSKYWKYHWINGPKFFVFLFFFYLPNVHRPRFGILIRAPRKLSFKRQQRVR